uniref:Uncharacterized protein n=1 Tax=Arundo donax TaxID=35708 RepID=A0A0A9AT77_ARUDO
MLTTPTSSLFPCCLNS